MPSRVFRAQWVMLLLATVVASIGVALASPRFGTSYNVYVILQAAATTAVIGMSQMVVLGVGDLSLAVGGIGSLSTVVVGNLVQVHHAPVVVACLAALGLGAVTGLLNGVIISRSRLSGFIVTLATGGALTGIGLGITKSAPYPRVPSALVTLGQGHANFFPYLVFVPLVLGAALAAFIRWMPAGRAILAVGGNRDAALLSGLSPTRSLLTAHTLSGVLASAAAVMYIGVLGTASPATGGDWLITSFAVPIIGGTALLGGDVSVMGCLMAALVLSTINDALIVLNVSQYAVTFAAGCLIFLAVIAGRFQLYKLLPGGRPSRRAEPAGSVAGATS